MSFKAKPLFAALMVAGTLMLSACNDDQSNAQQADTSQVSAEQQDIAKYNVFVEAANGQNFAKALMDHQKFYGDKIKHKKPLTEYSVVYPYNVKVQRENLEKALAMKGNLPELDAAAKPLRDALAKLEPINAELHNYEQSKGYLSDNGKKAQEKDAEYVADLTEVVKAQDVFLDAIIKRDEINTRTAFEEAEKGTEDYYRAGMILYAKEAVRRSDDFFATAGEQKAADAFKESLDKTGEMVEGWNAKKTEGGSQECSNVLLPANSFLSSGRDAIAHAAQGDYKRQSGMMQMMMNTRTLDEDSVSRNFDSLINALNQHRC